VPAISAQPSSVSLPRPTRPRVGAFAAELSPSGGIRWRWSDMMFVIHGFAPGEVQPTTDLWLAHVAGQDRDAVRSVLESTPATSVTVVYGLRDAQARHRLCVLVVAAGGRSGSLVDITEEWRRTAASTANEAIRSALVRTAPVDQAVGILMAEHEIDESAARDVLAAWAADTHQDASVAARALVHDSVRGAGLAAELRVYCTGAEDSRHGRGLSATA
jgi:hypothetical protein